jgi:hypothetical protein
MLVVDASESGIGHAVVERVGKARGGSNLRAGPPIGNAAAMRALTPPRRSP